MFNSQMLMSAYSGYREAEQGAEGGKASGGGNPVATIEHNKEPVFGTGSDKQPGKNDEGKKEHEKGEEQETEEQKAERLRLEAEKAKADVPADQNIDTYIERYKTENPAVSVALGFLKEHGINVTDDAFQLAEFEGDFSLLKAVLAQKGATGANEMLGILEKAVTEYHAECERVEQENDKLIRELLGEHTEDILAWASDNASDEEKAVINSLFEAGGLYTRAAAMLLNSAYSGASNVTVHAHNPVKVPASPDFSQPLSARDYAQEVNKLAQKYKGDPRGTAEYAALTARREAGRRKGI